MFCCEHWFSLAVSVLLFVLMKGSHKPAEEGGHGILKAPQPCGTPAPQGIAVVCPPFLLLLLFFCKLRSLVRIDVQTLGCLCKHLRHTKARDGKLMKTWFIGRFLILPASVWPGSVTRKIFLVVFAILDVDGTRKKLHTQMETKLWNNPILGHHKSLFPVQSE